MVKNVNIDLERPKTKGSFITGISIFCFLSLMFSCSPPSQEYNTFRGFAQGTTYSVIYGNNGGFDNVELRDTVESILHDFEMSLSVYEDSSVVSKINRNENVEIDRYFIDVFTISREIWKLTDGAFDITIAPLVNAYGFGPDTLIKFSESKRDSLMELIGMGRIVLGEGRIDKEDPRIELDFNAVAKGYSVDVIADFLESYGIKDYLVEIGGEIRAGGTNNGQLWRVGVDRPVEGNFSPGVDLQAILRMKDMALATSGNYRRFYIEDGVKYAHTIDPKTGDPARNSLLSATIIAPDCARADGIATACMVMGKDDAIKLIEGNRSLEGFLIYSDDSGNYRTWTSGGLDSLIDENP